MNDLKSISQIALSLGVSRQAVYSKLKSAELARAVKPLSVKQGNTTLYTLQAQKLIEQAFSAVAVKQVSSECQEEVDSLTSKLTESEKQLDIALRDIEAKTHELQEKEQEVKRLTESFTMLDNLVKELKADNATIELLKETLKALQEQLKEKDKQLSEANAHITELTATIKAEQEHSAQLTTALTQQQALHAGTIQQQLEQRETEQEEQPTKQPAEDPPKQKISFLQRLFKRK